jgi:succinate dehydrogenase/fumarate reductase-like Fe-S protein
MLLRKINAVLSLLTATLIAGRSSEEKPRIVRSYKTHFGAGCSKALSCQSVCPAGIETITSIMKMNRS